MSFDPNPQTMAEATSVIEQLRQSESELEEERNGLIDEIGELKARVRCENAVLEARIGTLENGVHSLRYFRDMGDLANMDPEKYGGYQSSTLYGESFDELAEELVGPAEAKTMPRADVKITRESPVLMHFTPCSHGRTNS